MPLTHAVLLRKVPEVTAGFWIAKVLTTGMGEATSDTLVHQIDPVIAVGLGFIGLVIALALQFAAPRYRPWIYWLAVVMVGAILTHLFIVGGSPLIPIALLASAIAIAYLRREQNSSSSLSIA